MAAEAVVQDAPVIIESQKGGAPSVERNAQENDSQVSASDLSEVFSLLDIPEGMLPVTQPEVESETVEETEAESESEAEGSAEENPEAEDDSPEEAGAPRSIAAMQQRIDKITAQKYEAMEARDAALKGQEALKAEVARLREQAEGAAVAAAPVNNDPLAAITSEADLDRAAEAQAAVREWALDNWDGVNPDGDPTTIKGLDGNPKELSAREVREYAKHAERILAGIPKRRAFLKQAREMDEQARRLLPEYFDVNSAQGQEYAARRKQFANVMQYPEGPMMLALMLKGHETLKADLEAREKAKASKPAVRKEPEIAPPSPVSRSVPAKSPAKRSQREDALEQMMRNPEYSEEFLTQYFAAR